MKHSFTRYIVALVALVALAACGAPATLTATQPASSPRPAAQTPDKPKIAANGTILTITTSGGHCVYGGCSSEIQIRADGSYHIKDGSGAERDGTLDAKEGAALTQQIAAADFEALRAQPFTGTCPIAYDGQELTYTFQTQSGSQTLASCQVAIDETSPLFVQVAGMVAAINQ